MPLARVEAEPGRELAQVLGQRGLEGEVVDLDAPHVERVPRVLDAGGLAVAALAEGDQLFRDFENLTTEEREFARDFMASLAKRSKERKNS